MRKRSILVAASLAISVAVGVFTWHTQSETTSNQEKREHMEPNLAFGLRENSDDVMRNAKVPIQKSTISTALMYDASRIATGVEPVFQFKDPKHGILFPQATDVEFMSDSEDGARISNIVVELKVPESPTNVNDDTAFEAYDTAMYRYVTDVIARINAAGWQRYIELSEPRLAGMDTYIFQSGYSDQKYVSQSVIAYGDPTYRLSLDQWKHLKRGGNVYWRWHADGMFLDLKYTKDYRSADLPIVLGDMLSAHIQTDEERLGVVGQNGPTGLSARRLEYQQKIPGRLEERKRAETEARAQGATILDRWTDATVAGVSVPGE
jgi:hypothetical protein